RLPTTRVGSSDPPRDERFTTFREDHFAEKTSLASPAEFLTETGAEGPAEMNREISETTAAHGAAKRLDHRAGAMQKPRPAMETLVIKAGQVAVTWRHGGDGGRDRWVGRRMPF
ncbi:hypothetical protein, partial [Streptomyces sp. NPDC001508]|uniref:hypothetical protein n=1 Tax=Streptomyces sp. NPDC001508 TaxID=3154656 RepID=UPI003333CC42